MTHGTLDNILIFETVLLCDCIIVFVLVLEIHLISFLHVGIKVEILIMALCAPHNLFELISRDIGSNYVLEIILCDVSCLNLAIYRLILNRRSLRVISIKWLVLF